MVQIRKTHLIDAFSPQEYFLRTQVRVNNLIWVKQIRQTDHFQYQVDRFHFRDDRPLRLSSRVKVLVFNLSELVLDVFFKCDAWLLLNFAVDQVLRQLAEILDYNNFVRMLAKMIQQEGLFPQVFEKTELFQSHVLRDY